VDRKDLTSWCPGKSLGERTGEPGVSTVMGLRKQGKSGIDTYNDRGDKGEETVQVWKNSSLGSGKAEQVSETRHGGNKVIGNHKT